MGPNTWKKPSPAAVPREARAWDSPNKSFKPAVTNTFKEQKTIMSKDLLESMRIDSHQIENINKG